MALGRWGRKVDRMKLSGLIPKPELFSSRFLTFLSPIHPKRFIILASKLEKKLKKEYDFAHGFYYRSLLFSTSPFHYVLVVKNSSLSYNHVTILSKHG